MAVKPRFTRIPKITELTQAGVPAEVIPTYCCLADHANNKTGLCWPTMERLAGILNRSVRTIQRHLQLLKEKGLIEFVERRRYKGRFSSYLYKVLHIATTGHGGRVEGKRTNRRRTKPSKNTPKSPSNSVKEGYHWLFGETAPQEKHQVQDQEEKLKREEAARRRTDGYEWLFT